jgi:TorA maturation chaperone TorD
VNSLVAAPERDTIRDGEITRALARASMYRLLGAAFACPSASIVAALPAAAERAARTADPEIAAKLLDWADTTRATAPDDLARAYVAALERPGGCSPYEGSYGAAPLLAGKGAELADIAGFYAAFGMAPDAGTAEVEDHVAAELEFMSALALKEAAALAEGEAEHVEVTRAAEVAFLRDHLGRWGASFAEALCAITTVAYFTKAAELLTAWLTADMSQLGVEVAWLGARLATDPEETKPFTCPMAAAGAEGK